jgi:hypothetical protein
MADFLFDVEKREAVDVFRPMLFLTLILHPPLKFGVSERLNVKSAGRYYDRSSRELPEKYSK